VIRPVEDTAGPMDRRWRWSLGAVVAVGLLSYVNAVGGEFVFDDLQLIVNNDLIKTPGHVGEIVFSNLWDALGRGSNYYRPLPPLLFMLLHAVFGLQPKPFHLVNIALHAGTAALVFLLARELLAAGAGRAATRAPWPALVAGLLFAAHPIHAEAVAWISGVMDVSATFFSLLALWTYVRSTRPGRFQLVAYGVSLAALMLALLSKEPAVVVPVLLVLYDLLYRRHAVAGLGAAARRWAPPLAVVGVYLALRIVALGRLAPLRTAADIDPTAMLVNLPVLFSRYVQKLIVPTGLTVVHDLGPPLPPVSLRAVAALTVVALCAVAVAWAARRDHRALMAAMIFVLPLLPSLYVPALSQRLSNAFAERYAYFPSAGAALAVAIVLDRLARQRPRWYRVMLPAALAVAAVFGGMTLARNTVWTDSYTLWSDAVRKTPDLPVAHTNLGLALIRLGRADEGRHELQTALRLDPTLAEQSLISGVNAARRGQFLVAILAFQTALAYTPDLVEARYNLAVAFDGKGWTDLAIAEYRAAIALAPRHADAHNNLAILLAQHGRLDEAVSHFEASVGARPDDGQFRLNLARAYELTGRSALAEEQRRAAARPGATSAR
jgi:Flp pilus assembly protein TadD